MWRRRARPAARRARSAAGSGDGEVVVSEVALLRQGLTSHLVVLPVVMLRGPPSTMGASCREARQWMVRGDVEFPGVKNRRTLVVAMMLQEVQL